MQDVQERKKRIFSGIQPTGVITLGNYIGAMKNWVALQQDYECIFCVVDQHAITVRQDPAALRKKTMELLALYIAAGIDPEEHILFVQSHVAGHAQLAWVLNCVTGMGELSRMTQFKEKSQKHAENINAGLFDYPVLMAADILLYQADLVPVGGDQKQHVELTRDIAIRFNGLYSPTFTVPEPYIPSVGARIKSLVDPTRKMSKSDEEASYICLTDTPDAIRKKLRRAVTDSGAEVVFDEQQKPGVSNLLTILSCMTGEDIPTCQARFEGQGYGVFKDAVADAVIAGLEPLQQQFKRLLADKAYLEGVMRTGAERAQHIAAKTLSKVYRKVGFVERPR
nr:tryptophan--tRNA ligase [bacterium]